VIGIPSEGLAVILLTNRQNFGVGSNTRYSDLGELQQELVETVLRVHVRGVQPRPWRWYSIPVESLRDYPPFQELKRPKE
jgi:hypothetical protein